MFMFIIHYGAVFIKSNEALVASTSPDDKAGRAFVQQMDWLEYNQAKHRQNPRIIS